MIFCSRAGRLSSTSRTRSRISPCSNSRCGESGSLGTITAGSVELSIVSRFAIGDVDSIVLMRRIVRSSRGTSEPTRLARSASVGSAPSSRRNCSRAASSSRRTRRTPRGHASRRSASIIAPRTRRSANVSNLMPRPSSNRCAASISPITPSCTRSPRSIECGMVEAMRRASDSTNGRLDAIRSCWWVANGMRITDPPGPQERPGTTETQQRCQGKDEQTANDACAGSSKLTICLIMT